MGILSFFGRGRDKRLAELEKKVKEAQGKVHLGGLKGERLNAFVRAAITSMHFKWIQKKESRAEDDLDKLKQDIAQHLVIAAEDEEMKAVQLIVQDYMYLYLTLHSLLLYEKHDLEEFGVFVGKLAKFCEKKKIDKAVVQDMTKVLHDVAEGWKKDVEELRQMINAVFAKTQDRNGWSLGMFNRLHKEGYFIRYQERKRFKDTIRDEKKVATALKTVEAGHIKSIDDLKKIVAGVGTTEKEINVDFETIYKMLLNTWNHITSMMGELLRVTKSAASAHELPERDMDDMLKLHNMIVENLEEGYLHALRLDDKQLEGTYSEVMDRIEELKKAA
jgi:hypothetical protein